MTALLTLLLVMAFSLLVTRIGTVALTHTGLSRESARFQARSAFSGAGFTTDESESVVRHPVRRRIIMLLILMGSVGLVSSIASLMLTFAGPGGATRAVPKLGLLVAGVLALWFLASSQWVDRRLSRVISWALRRWTSLDVRDYAAVLHLSGDYRVAELHVEDEDWLADKSLAELRLSEEGVLVLAVERPSAFLGAPRGETAIQAGDTLVVYGREASLAELDERRRGVAGDVAHARAVAEQEAEERREREMAEPPGGAAEPRAES
jgi:hypothetical protein